MRVAGRKFAIGGMTGRVLHAGALLGIWGLTSSCALAQRGYNWECHASGGTFDYHDFDVPETATEFTGEMVIHQRQDGTQWKPLAKVAFIDGGLERSSCHCNGIEAVWYDNDPKWFGVFLTADGKYTELGRVPYENPVTFKLTFVPDGNLKLEVGTGVATGVSFLKRRNMLHLNCSSADVSFRKIVVK